MIVRDGQISRGIYQIGTEPHPWVATTSDRSTSLLHYATDPYHITMATTRLRRTFQFPAEDGEDDTEIPREMDEEGV